MMKLRSVTAGALAAAMLATSATPAMAQGYPGGYPSGTYGYPGGGYGGGYRGSDRNRHRDRGISAGDVIAGVAVIGIIAAIASAASNKNRTRNDGTNAGYTGNIRTDDQAADACASAAERQIGGNARTRSIDTVSRVSDGFNVRGTVGSSFDDRTGNRDQRSFTCSIRYGDVQRVDFGGYAYNY